MYFIFNRFSFNFVIGLYLLYLLKTNVITGGIQLEYMLWFYVFQEVCAHDFGMQTMYIDFLFIWEILQLDDFTNS